MHSQDVVPELSLADLVQYQADDVFVVIRSVPPLDGTVTPEKVFKALKSLHVSNLSASQCDSLFLAEFGSSEVTMDRFQMRMKSTLSPKEFVTLELIEKTPLSPDTHAFKFVLPTPDHYAGHSCGDFVLAKVQFGNEEEHLFRPYTLISHPGLTGWLELLVKRKRPSGVSDHFSSMELNDLVEFQGPFQQLPWKRGRYRRVAFLCAGTGIAAAMPILKDLFEPPPAGGLSENLYTAHITLIAAWGSPKDILCRQELDDWRGRFPKRFHCIHLVTRSVAPGKYVKGRINETICSAYLPKPSRKTLVVVCGPSGFNDRVSEFIKRDYPNVYILKA